MRLSVIVFLAAMLIYLPSCTSEPSLRKSKEQSIAPATLDIQETRIVYREKVNIRTGPGTTCEKDTTSGYLLKDEIIYVLEEKDGWVRFRTLPESAGWSGWVRKDLTSYIGNGYATESALKVKKLRDLGLLVRINPMMNEAFIEPSLWNGLDFQVKQNIGYHLACYCSEKKKTTAIWVDIKDTYSGKRIAKYSQAYGFKTY